jgi:peptidoglycan/xylan/chitin deacetylase (PgdA/CDA1 family)
MEFVTGRTPLGLPGKALVKQLVFRALGVVQSLNHQTGQQLLLTFDDGPHPAYTPAVLDRLQKFNARAVFFVIGRRIGRCASLLRRMQSEGHLIGNHTYSHRKHGWFGLKAYLRNVGRCQEAVAAVTGREPTLFRPPWGMLSLASLTTPRMFGLRTVYWSVDPCDYLLSSPEETVASAERLSRNAKSGDIVLLHDVHRHILPLLDVLLPRLAEQGFDLRRGAEQLGEE